MEDIALRKLLNEFFALSQVVIDFLATKLHAALREGLPLLLELILSTFPVFSLFSQIKSWYSKKAIETFTTQ